MKKWISSAMLGVALAWGGHAVAQDAGNDAQGNAGQPPGMQDVRTDFTDSELQTFVEIQKDIGDIRNEYAGKLQSVQDQQKAEQLQQQARDELIKVVEEADLTVDEYNEIAQAYQVSPEVRQRVNEMVQE